VPIGGSPAAQIAFGKAMLTKANRHALAQKLKIPPQNQAAFEAAILGLAEQSNLLTHDGRVAFVNGLANLVRQYQA